MVVSTERLVHCECCGVDIKSYGLKKHYKTFKHINNKSNLKTLIKKETIEDFFPFLKDTQFIKEIPVLSNREVIENTILKKTNEIKIISNKKIESISYNEVNDKMEMLILFKD